MTRQHPDNREPTDMPGAGKPEQPLQPGLYLVATPIGHARDITLRALDVLRQADVVACEDTRVTRNLLTIHGIDRPLLAYNDHNAPEVRPRLLAFIAQGQSVALVSDAGMPLVADPGYRLVQEVVAQGALVTSLPGASATLAALQLSGLPSDRFLFAGFLAPKSGERRRTIATLAKVPATLIFYEAPHRLVEALGDLADILGRRPAAVARELTKKFEEMRRDDLPALAAHYAGHGSPRGEIVIVVGPPEADDGPSADDIDDALRDAMSSASVRDAADEVAARFGLGRRQVYARALELRRLSASERQ